MTNGSIGRTILIHKFPALIAQIDLREDMLKVILN